MAHMRDSLLLGRRRGASSGHPPLRALGALLMLAACGLMVLSRLDHSQVRAFRASAAAAAAPVIEAAHAPLAPVRGLIAELQSREALVQRAQDLEGEARELRQWKARAAELERQLSDLSRLQRLVSAPATPFVTARVIGAGGERHVRALLIAAGRNERILAGHPVLDADGLVGRVVESTEAVARVLLLTDPASRVPVHIGASRRRALLVGDGSGTARLEHLAEGEPPLAGEEVLTSGLGGLFPQGLRIGSVTAGVGTERSVHLDADTERLSFVRVLLHASPMLEISDGPGARAVGRRAQALPDRSKREAP